MLRPTLPFQAPMLFMVICTFLLAACSDDKLEQTTEPVVRPVKLISVNEVDARQQNRYPAVVDAAQSSTLTFEVGGLVESVNVKESQEIKKGDVIASLRQRDFQNNVDAAKAQFSNAEAEYQRALRLSKADAIAKADLEQRKLQRDVAKTNLDSSVKALEDAVLKAPFDGVVAELPVDALESVQPGTVVASIINLSSLQASIDLPSSIISTVEQRKDKQAYVILEANPDQKIQASFKEAKLTADVISQTYRVTFTFASPENLLILPGMNATVVLESSNSADIPAVVLPLSAILSQGDSQFVWLVDETTMTVTKQAVTVEQGIGDELVINEGLKPGDMIVGAGAAYLSEGMQVRAWEK